MLYVKFLTRCFVPIAHLLLQFIVFHLSLNASHQRLRIFLLPLLLLFGLLSLWTSDRLIVPNVTSLWSQSLALNILHTGSVLFIEKWPAPRDISEPMESLS